MVRSLLFSHSPANFQGHQDRPTALPRFLVSLVAFAIGLLVFPKLAAFVSKFQLPRVCFPMSEVFFPILQYLFLRPMKKVFFLLRQNIYIDTVGKCFFQFFCKMKSKRTVDCDHRTGLNLYTVYKFALGVLKVQVMTSGVLLWVLCG